MTPRVSIVVPVYRVEAYLPECLESLLSFAGDEIEIIAINDDSPDKCGAILDQYAKTDERLVIVHMPENVGVVQARNAGLDAARGDYVWFVDPDDWLPKGAIQRVLDGLAATEPSVLVIGHAEVYPDGTFDSFLATEHAPFAGVPFHLSEHPRLLRIAPSACTKIGRRSLIVDLGLRFHPGWYEDCSFSLALLMAAPTIVVLDSIAYCYRRFTPGSITSSRSDRHFEVFNQYERIFERVASAGGKYDVFRPELFRFMINHYLVILGNEWRLSDGQRREFFARAVADYRRWYPKEGYEPPDGAAGIKHELLRRNSYAMYASLRHAYRVYRKRISNPATAQQKSALPQIDLMPSRLPVRPLVPSARGGSDELEVAHPEGHPTPAIEPPPEA